MQFLQLQSQLANWKQTAEELNDNLLLLQEQNVFLKRDLEELKAKLLEKTTECQKYREQLTELKIERNRIEQALEEKISELRERDTELKKAKQTLFDKQHEPTSQELLSQDSSSEFEEFLTEGLESTCPEKQQLIKQLQQDLVSSFLKLQEIKRELHQASTKGKLNSKIS